ncbi:MAG: alpha-mannosidase, partial [Actinomycetota bacterium]|nr:alpha-mannosidase [Actinomycetota bacterium]
MAGEPEVVYLVPHTHWDREWYEPFQRFRMRLVDLLDDVLSRAEADPQFHFTLDGQTAAIADHLEVRPADTDRVMALVRSGQLAVGPWQILLDEFLCSGETIVRNLENGWREATKLGASMAVGYLPDMFGHCAQMPQILRLAGMEQACLWRGVPSAVDFHSFRWAAPDGSSVRCEYLPGGYGNAAYLLSDAAALDQRAAEFTRRVRPWFGQDPILAMYGTDHAAPLPSLMSTVRSLGEGRGPIRLEVCTLEDYINLLDPEDEALRTCVGELRSHARANILPGVLSVRGHLKRDMGRAERMVTRYAEPWAALWGQTWPGQFLDMAWERLIACSGHDSITGCGVDETAIQVAARIAEADHLGQAVRDRVVKALAREVAGDAALIINPSPERRTAVVPLTFVVAEDEPNVHLELADGSQIATQEIGRSPRLLFEGDFPAEALREALIRRSFGQELFGRRIQAWTHEEHTITFHVGRVGDPTFDIDAAADEIDRLARASGDRWTLRVLAEPLRSVLADIPTPALGWTTVRVADPALAGTPDSRVAAPVLVRGSTLDNGLVSVSVRKDGCLRVAAADGTVLEGVGRIIDGGDVGDTYNYAPPRHDLLVETPAEMRMHMAEHGPL